MSTQGLSASVEEGDYQGLVDVMARLLAVKDKQTTADHMFEPLTKTIVLLKTYQQELPDAVHLQLQVSIVNTVKLCRYIFLYCLRTTVLTCIFASRLRRPHGIPKGGLHVHTYTGLFASLTNKVLEMCMHKNISTSCGSRVFGICYNPPLF